MLSKNNEFPIEKGYNSEFFKPSVVEEFLNLNYTLTKKELKGIFTLDEIMIIISVFSSHYYSINFCGKKELIDELEKSIHNGLVTTDNYLVFMPKIDKLTEFQAFTLIRMVIEFWSGCLKSGDGSCGYMDIKRIFLFD